MPDILDHSQTAITPLQIFADSQGRQMPELTWLTATDLPPAAFSLLVHDGPMTPTLAKHHKCKIKLQIVAQTMHDDYLERLVRLRAGSNTARVVEAAAVVIHFQALPVDARAAVLAGMEPLGSILISRAISHLHQPRGFFAGKCDAWMADLLDGKTGEPFYGRCNRISTQQGLPVAEIVECIPGWGDVS